MGAARSSPTSSTHMIAVLHQFIRLEIDVIAAIIPAHTWRLQRLRGG